MAYIDVRLRADTPAEVFEAAAVLLTGMARVAGQFEDKVRKVRPVKGFLAILVALRTRKVRRMPFGNSSGPTSA